MDKNLLKASLDFDKEQENTSKDVDSPSIIDQNGNYSYKNKGDINYIIKLVQGIPDNRNNDLIEIKHILEDELNKQKDKIETLEDIIREKDKQIASLKDSKNIRELPISNFVDWDSIIEIEEFLTDLDIYLGKDLPEHFGQNDPYVLFYIDATDKEKYHKAAEYIKNEGWKTFDISRFDLD